MRAATNHERFIEALKAIAAALSQQPVVQTAGKVGEEIAAGFQGNTANDPDWKTAAITYAGKANPERLMRAIANTPGASAVDEGLVLDLLRRQKPEQGGMPSVRGGTFWMPSLDDPLRAMYTGRSGYGGSHIIKRTGERFENPIVAEAASGGRVPQLAMDAVTERGTYDAMRDEVLKQLVGKHWNTKPTVEEIMQLLRRFGGDPDLAGDILQFSRQGNQLPYAIQENVAGNVIRNAGHDAAVGYSPRRMRLSEVFDLRPSAATYPWR
jgi:hypothetical protein